MIDQSSINIKRITNQTTWTPKYYYLIAVVFVASLLISNVLAVKFFDFGPFVFTAGILVFPISYIFGDVLTECYGFRRTRQIIWIGFAANLIFAALLQITIWLPPAQGWELQTEFEQVHGMIPRVVLASVIAYWIGEYLNSVVMSVMKKRSNGKHLWKRAVLSTLVGQGADSLLFGFIGFFGVFPTQTLLMSIASAWAFKVSYEITVSPLTVRFATRLKNLEGIDQFDTTERYLPV